MKVLSVVLVSSLATAASAVAAISAHVCRTISNRDKTRALDRMSQLLKDCPPEECESVAEAVAKVADSFFPQPSPTLADRSPRRRNRGESALSLVSPLGFITGPGLDRLYYSNLMWLQQNNPTADRLGDSRLLQRMSEWAAWKGARKQ